LIAIIKCSSLHQQAIQTLWKSITAQWNNRLAATLADKQIVLQTLILGKYELKIIFDSICNLGWTFQIYTLSPFSIKIFLDLISKLTFTHGADLSSTNLGSISSSSVKTMAATFGDMKKYKGVKLTKFLKIRNGRCAI
jgi:hypothetical protein